MEMKQAQAIALLGGLDRCAPIPVGGDYDEILNDLWIRMKQDVPGMPRPFLIVDYGHLELRFEPNSIFT